MTDLIHSAITLGWTLGFAPSGNRHLPVLCHASRRIELLSPAIHRYAVGTCAGITPTDAADRAMTCAERDETRQIEYHSARAPTDTTRPDLSDLLNLHPMPGSAPTIPPAILRRF